VDADPMDAPPVLHPTDQILASYGLGKLDGASAESVDKHLESCPACRRRVAELSADTFLGRVRDAQGGPGSAAPIVSSLDGLSMPATGANLPAPPAAGDLPPGLADHPDYEILRELGRGGMGVVYLARNALMGRLEVLKVVGHHLIERKGVLDRFNREIRAAARLDHPNIVHAYSAFRSGASLVLAMEYVEGLDLARIVKARGPLPMAHACYYVQKAALGLQHAHEHNLVHRDIKPGNLMLSRKGDRAVVKVLDFGLAKATREDQIDNSLTVEGQILGTPDFIAPEQIRNAQSADIRADIYSLGCTLYYLLTGGPPFRGASLYDMLQAHFSMEATPLNLARPEVPGELAALVAKMMAKEPGRRFQQPSEVAQALTPFFKQKRVESLASKAEPSQARQDVAPSATAGAPVVPARPAAGSSPALTLPVSTPGQRPEPEPLLDRLAQRKQTASSRDGAPAVAWNRRPPWLWPAVAAGALLVGIVAVWGAIVKIRTPPGITAPQDSHAQAKDDAGNRPSRPDRDGPPTKLADEAVVEISPTPPQVPAASSSTDPTVAVDNADGKAAMPGRRPNERARPQTQATVTKADDMAPAGTGPGPGSTPEKARNPQKVVIEPERPPVDPGPNEALSLAFSARGLTPQDVQSLEEQVVKDPNDVTVRTRLVGYYLNHQFANPPAREARQKHILWLIKNAPESAILGTLYGSLNAFLDKGAYSQARKAWLDQLKKTPANLKVLDHSATFFELGDEERKLAMVPLKSARALDGENPKWPERLGHLYSSLALNASSLKDRKDAAGKAQEQFEIAYKLSTDRGRASLLRHLARTALAAGNMVKAREYAETMLNQSGSGSNSGENTHYGNIVLGRIALRMGKVKDAEEHLIKAGQTPGSPELNSYGPDMALAKELLERNEKEVVLQYFELCSKFWKPAQRDRLERWTASVKAGQMPDFGTNLNR
jgi:serine/threonine protein kinase